ncbi:MAG: hypothetical protein ACOCXT_04020 [Candidatus Dojkabacteria bacterium]
MEEVDDHHLINKIRDFVTNVGNEEHVIGVVLRRSIRVNERWRDYEYIHQVEDGLCTWFTFMNLWSYIHGYMPNIEFTGSPISGVNSDQMIEFFSWIHDNNPNNLNFQFAIDSTSNPEQQLNTSTQLVDFLDTISAGSMIIGAKGLCTALHRVGEDAFVLVDPLNLQGLEVFSRNNAIAHLTSLLEAPNDIGSFFYFIGPDVNKT